MKKSVEFLVILVLCMGLAASNAIGKWLHEYPVTPDRVLRALGKVSPKKGKGGSL